LERFLTQGDLVNVFHFSFVKYRHWCKLAAGRHQATGHVFATSQDRVASRNTKVVRVGCRNQGRPVGGSGGSAEPPVLGWEPKRRGWGGKGRKEKKRGRKKEKEGSKEREKEERKKRERKR